MSPVVNFFHDSNGHSDTVIALYVLSGLTIISCSRKTVPQSYLVTMIISGSTIINCSMKTVQQSYVVTTMNWLN
jgi:hypothetical protein